MNDNILLHVISLSPNQCSIYQTRRKSWQKGMCNEMTMKIHVYYVVKVDVAIE